MVGIGHEGGRDSTCAVAVMAKASAPGRTKTRLVPPLTFEEAAACNTAFLADVVANVRAAGPGIVPMIAFGPVDGGDFFRRTLGEDVVAFPAVLPSFGACLVHALETAFAAGHDHAAVLNADSPTLPPAYLAEMAEVLSLPGDRVVLGHSADGGYYVLGLKRLHRALFTDIDWSTERVAAQTCERARTIGLPVHRLPEWYDVDDAPTLRTLHGELFAGRQLRPGGPPAGAARQTRALMRDLLDRSGLGERLGLFPVVAEA